jgi:hypothetical protein
METKQKDSRNNSSLAPPVVFARQSLHGTLLASVAPSLPPLIAQPLAVTHAGHARRERDTASTV